MNNNNKKDQLVHVPALSSQSTFGDSSNDKIVKLKVILCILTAVSLCDVLLSFTLLLRSSFRINSPNTDLDIF
jgi:hypothetical protein